MSENSSPRVLALGGLDPGGGAGLMADAEAITAAGGQPRITCAALTAQGEEGVAGVLPVPPDFLDLQLRSIGAIDALKTGMLWSAGTVRWVAARARGGQLPAPVVDPVLWASSGGLLSEPEAIRVIRRTLLPRARAVTPNLTEAAHLCGMPVESLDQMEDAARWLVGRGVGLAVITGGHLEGTLVDVGMGPDDDRPWRIERERVPGTARGTGCRFASALATFLALGVEDRRAVERAGVVVAEYVRERGV